jgi:hypothetical protein
MLRLAKLEMGAEAKDRAPKAGAARMKYLITKDAAAELEGVTVREIERRAAAGEVRTQKSSTPARNRT